MKKKKFSEIEEENTSPNSPENKKKSNSRIDNARGVKIKFSDTDFDDADFDDNQTLKKVKQENLSEEDSNLKSTNDEESESPDINRLKNTGDDFDNLYYSPDTPTPFITRGRSGAIDLEDPMIDRSYAFDYRDPEDRLPSSSTENSPASIRWTPPISNENNTSDEKVDGLTSLLGDQNFYSLNQTVPINGVRLNFEEFGMTLLGSTDSSS